MRTCEKYHAPLSSEYRADILRGAFAYFECIRGINVRIRYSGLLTFQSTQHFLRYSAAAYGEACSKANLLQNVGEKTPIFIRFSTVTLGRESPDSARNPRGFAINFYTAEGNYDIVGLNWVSYETIHFNSELLIPR